MPARCIAGHRVGKEINMYTLIIIIINMKVNLIYSSFNSHDNNTREEEKKKKWMMMKYDRNINGTSDYI